MHANRAEYIINRCAAVGLDCGSGHFVYTLDEQTDTLVDLMSFREPNLSGCADQGVWAHTKRVMALITVANCRGNKSSLITVNFATTPPQTTGLTRSDDVGSVAWSWDDSNLAYSTSNGLWVRDERGSEHQIYPQGSQPTWKP